MIRGVLLVPSSSPPLPPTYDGLDMSVTSNITWFHLNHDMVSRRIYKLPFYGGRSITTRHHNQPAVVGTPRMITHPLGWFFEPIVAKTRGGTTPKGNSSVAFWKGPVEIFAHRRGARRLHCSRRREKNTLNNRARGCLLEYTTGQSWVLYGRCWYAASVPVVYVQVDRPNFSS